MAGDQLPALKVASFKALDKRSMSATLVNNLNYLVGKESAKARKDYLSIYPFNCLSIYLSIYPSSIIQVLLSIYLLSIYDISIYYLFIYLPSIYLSILLSNIYIYLYIYVSLIYLSSICWHTYHPSICIFIYPSIPPFINLHYQYVDLIYNTYIISFYLCIYSRSLSCEWCQRGWLLILTRSRAGRLLSPPSNTSKRPTNLGTFALTL